MRYPNPQKTREFIQRIPQHLNRLDYKAIVIECNANFPTVPICYYDLTNKPNLFNKHDAHGRNLIYRAQLINGDNLPYNTIARLSYNPDIGNISFGRFNKPYESMFYASTNELAACNEVISKNYLSRNTNVFNFTVGVWEIINPLKFATIPYSDKQVKYLHENHPFPSKVVTPLGVSEINESWKNQFEPIEYEVLQFFADEVAKLDITNEHDYYITNYFADTVFEQKDPKYDGILYPSVCSSYEVHNLALKPDCVNRNLRFVHANHVKMINFGTESKYIGIKTNVKADENGKLLWEGRGFTQSPNIVKHCKYE